MKTVYFLRSVSQDGPVKIGCSKAPMRRLMWLSRKSNRMEIIASIPGDFRMEKRFHRLLLSDHIGGEWFTWSERVEAVVAAIRGNNFDLSSLPDEARGMPREDEYSPSRRAHLAMKGRKQVADRIAQGLPPFGNGSRYWPDDEIKSILDFIDTATYAEAAKHFGLSRSTIAGIAHRWRDRDRPVIIPPYEVFELEDDDDDWAEKVADGSRRLLAAIFHYHPTICAEGAPGNSAAQEAA